VQTRPPIIPLSLSTEDLKDFFGRVYKIRTKRGCWEWPYRRQDGYGKLWLLGKDHRVHRLSAVAFLGLDLHSPLCSLHKCDNPPCFNFEHLFIGTNADNIKDAINKGKFLNRGFKSFVGAREMDIIEDATEIE